MVKNKTKDYIYCLWQQVVAWEGTQENFQSDGNVLHIFDWGAAYRIIYAFVKTQILHFWSVHFTVYKFLNILRTEEWEVQLMPGGKEHNPLTDRIR